MYLRGAEEKKEPLTLPVYIVFVLHFFTPLKVFDAMVSFCMVHESANVKNLNSCISLRKVLGMRIRTTLTHLIYKKGNQRDQ